jgi:hypothetical protein
MPSPTFWIAAQVLLALPVRGSRVTAARVGFAPTDSIRALRCSITSSSVPPAPSVFCASASSDCFTSPVSLFQSRPWACSFSARSPSMRCACAGRATLISGFIQSMTRLAPDLRTLVMAGATPPKTAPVAICPPFDSPSGVNIALDAAAPLPLPESMRIRRLAEPPPGIAAAGRVAATFPARRGTSTPASLPRPAS